MISVMRVTLCHVIMAHGCCFLIIIDVTLTLCTLHIVQLCQPSDPSLISPSVSGCQPLVPRGVYAMVSTMSLCHLAPVYVITADLVGACCERQH